MATEEESPPRLFVEPPIPCTSEFTDVAHVRGVISQLDTGNFRQPALLVERMLMNPRLRAVVDTRLAGLISTTIRFEPSANNRDARRAAKEFAEDWPRICPSPMRKQMMKWSLMLGFDLGQRPLATSPETGRQVLQLRPYWPGFVVWNPTTRVYRIQTMDRGVVDVGSPSSPQFVPESMANSPWLISEPFGVNSFREGMIHAAWRPWLGHDWAMRDQARASEKHGLGIVKVKVPRGQGLEYKSALSRFTEGVRTLGSEGVVVCEQREDGPSFDIEPMEFNGSGFQAIADNMNSCAVALAILWLGHNLTTEVKGGGSYAAIGVGDLLRDDKKVDDAAAEWAYVAPQLAAPWAELNYGDPGLAPVAHYITDSPAVNKTAADTLAALGQAVSQLRQYMPRADVDALGERFRVPLLAEGKVQVPVAAPPAGDATKKPAEPDGDEPAEPTDDPKEAP